MASFVARRAIGTVSAAATSGAIAVSGITAGNKLSVHLIINPPGVGTLGGAAPTDSAGNTYTQRLAKSSNATGSIRGGAWYDTDTAAGAPTTVTFNISGSGTFGYVLYEWVSGMTWDSVLGGAAIGSTAANTAMTTASVTPAGGGETAVAVFGPGVGETSMTPGGSYVSLGAPRGAQVEVWGEYLDSAPAGAQAATATAANSGGALGYIWMVGFYIPTATSPALFAGVRPALQAVNRGAFFCREWTERAGLLLPKRGIWVPDGAVI